MSFKNPGDGVRCDHCDRGGELFANRGERLCLSCLNRSVDESPVTVRDEYGVMSYAPGQVPAYVSIRR